MVNAVYLKPSRRNGNIVVIDCTESCSWNASGIRHSTRHLEDLNNCTGVGFFTDKIMARNFANKNPVMGSLIHKYGSLPMSEIAVYLVNNPHMTSNRMARD